MYSSKKQKKRWRPVVRNCKVLSLIPDGGACFMTALLYYHSGLKEKHHKLHVDQRRKFIKKHKCTSGAKQQWNDQMYQNCWQLCALVALS